MSNFYIDAADRKRIVTFWVQVTLWALHIWATVLVCAVPWFNAETATIIAGMFATTVTGIGLTLALLLFDRAADVVLNKLAGTIGNPPVAVKETTERVVTPMPMETSNVQATQPVEP